MIKPLLNILVSSHASIIENLMIQQGNDPIYFDTETCGLHGMPITLQYQYGNNPVVIHEFWTRPVSESLLLIEMMATNPGGVIGFNITFDWFHLQKTYNTFSLFADNYGYESYPSDFIDEIAILEDKARDGPCLKPASCLDLMLEARRGSYQSTMNRNDIRVRRVPSTLAWKLAEELEKRVAIKDIYFARRADKYAPKWKVHDTDDADFKDVVLNFSPSSALKALVCDALGVKPDAVLLFANVAVDKVFNPVEYGYAPYALAVGKPGKWNGAWPAVIQHHITHWGFNELARKYAAKDVEYLPRLYEFFGKPPMDDDDSVLACAVASCRWRGFKIDTEGVKTLRKKALIQRAKTPIAPSYARRYIEDVLEPIERVALQGSTKKTILEDIAKWEDHPAAKRAQEVLDARMAAKEVELYDKLLLAGRFHASFKVIGTLSSRMAGTDGLNPQGIKKTKTVRRCFPLAWDGYILSAGDFKSFEVVLADACYADPDLRRDLQTENVCSGCKGKKTDKRGNACSDCNGTGRCAQSIHAIFGTCVYPGMSYVDVLNTKGTDDDKYTRSKSAVFAMLYGGEGHTLMTRLGVNIDDANAAYALFTQKYKKVGEERKKVFDSVCSMRQPNGIGTKVEWHEPADFIASPFGFRRYFTLENNICRALFDLAQDPPQEWRDLKIKVVRRERLQTVSGATQSALYGAAFQIQAANMRAACNHVIQSAGATLTKGLQRRLWDLQPSGVSEFKLQVMNVHDEILAPCKPDMIGNVEATVHEYVESYREQVPLIAIDWGSNLADWSEK